MSGLDEENNDPAIQNSHTSTSLKSLIFGGPDLWANNANVPFPKAYETRNTHQWIGFFHHINIFAKKVISLP